MAGLHGIFATKDILCSLEEHSNCDVVIDGSNIQYFFSSRAHALTNLPEYEAATRTYLQHFLDVGITPHVFFDGPSSGDAHKWERGRQRRQDRLEKLMHHTCDSYRFEYPQPTAVQDIFRDVIHSLGIRSIQVSAKKDYTLEMLYHARYLDAFLISGNTKFFLDDIRRGFVCPVVNSLGKFAPTPRCIMRTFHFDKLRRLVGLERSKNPYALTMWRLVMFDRKTFKNFVVHFSTERARQRPEFYPRGHCPWIQNLLARNGQKALDLKMLQFFLENTPAEAERIVLAQLYPGVREEASLLFQQNVAAHHIEPYDAFERIENQIEAGDFCEETLPQWFLRYLSVEVKVIPGLLDILSCRRHHLLVFVEDFQRESVNDTTLRLRRIIYGILFADREVGDDTFRVTELDRVGGKLEELVRTPIWQLWNPKNRGQPRLVPGLTAMESLSEWERIELYLLSMGVDENFWQEIESMEALYVTVMLKYWVVASTGLKKEDLIRLLLTILLVENRYSKSSNVFTWPVKLDVPACSNLNIEFHQQSVAPAYDALSCMHPHSQLQNVMVFGRVLHRLYMQPLGTTVDSIETITSEVVFYRICQITGNFNIEELKDFVMDLVDEHSRENFIRTVDFIWDKEAMKLGKLIVKGFRGDDKRP